MSTIDWEASGSGPNRPDVSATAQKSETIGIAPSSLSDVSTIDDRLGFSPYVAAVANFLSSPDTKPPLTLSVEGEWGSGKSSFMSQLRDALRQIANRRSTPAPVFIDFNAWRSDKDEAVWASFALEFIRTVTRGRGALYRYWSDIKLIFQRFDWGTAKWRLAQAMFLWLAFLGILTYMLLVPKSNPNAPIYIANLVGFAALIALIASAIEKTRKAIGNPLSIDLRKFVDTPDYGRRRAFGETFNEDLKRVIAAYVDPRKRIYVFIDDVDRCEAPKAADLMQALTVLMSVEQSQLIFILGLDRKMVAASIAYKYENLIPYLAASASPNVQAQTGLDYGYMFLEKFIQLPFQVPRATREGIDRLIRSFSGTASDTQSKGIDDEDRQLIEVTLGTESPIVRDIADLVAVTLEMNPRRIKQFVNIFRLRAYIASETGMFTDNLTMHQLGVFVATTLRWPRLLDALYVDPKLLVNIANKQPEALNTEWGRLAELRTLLETCTERPETDMRRADISKLLVISPRYSRHSTDSSNEDEYVPGDPASPKNDAGANTAQETTARKGRQKRTKSVPR